MIGLLSIGVPESAGGSGGGALCLAVVAEEIAKVAGGFAIGAMASILAPAALEITADAVQIHGANGYVEDCPVERYFRLARVGTIWEGTSGIQQQIICRELGLYGA